jgi:REP element-mobilizing transposase RayT
MGLRWEEGGRVPYWQLFYHLVWSTKNREPLLTPQAEKHIYGFLTSKAVGLNGVVYTVGGTVDHVHMVVTIPPAIAVAKFVGQIKGVASARLNKSGISAVRFEWQAEYGAFSFDAKRLPYFIGYVERQKEHHDDGTIIPILERMTSDNEAPRLMKETTAPYAMYEMDEDGWRDELLQLDAASHAQP